VHTGYVLAYATALQPVFFAAGCIGIAAFLLVWLIPEVALKDTTLATDPGRTYAMPTDRSSAQELERALSLLANRENRARRYKRLAEVANMDLDPPSCWMLVQLGQMQPTDAELSLSPMRRRDLRECSVFFWAVTSRTTNKYPRSPSLFRQAVTLTRQSTCFSSFRRNCMSQSLIEPFRSMSLWNR
jgi:hypothetical protein